MSILTRTKKAVNVQRPRYQSLQVDTLKLADYQRELIKKKVLNYSEHYDEKIFGTILVSYRDNQYWILDGQHRVEAAKKLGINTVWCQIIEGLSYEEEAIEFHKVNTRRVPLNVNQKFHALVEAKDKSAIDIVNILQEYGLTYSRRGQETKNHCINAVGSVQKIHKKNGKEHLDSVLRIITKAWNGDYTSFRAEILKGVSTFIQNYKYHEEVLVEVLEKIDPLKLISIGRNSVMSSRASRSDGTCFHIAKTIRDLYDETASKKGYNFCERQYRKGQKLCR